MLRAAFEQSLFLRSVQGSCLLAAWRAVPQVHRLFEDKDCWGRFRPIFNYLPLGFLSMILAAVLLFPADGRFQLLGAIACAAFVFPIPGVALLPAALLWSPRFHLHPGITEAAFLRLDHALLLGVACRMFCMRAYRPKDSPLSLPIVLFALALALSTLAGIQRGLAPSPPTSFAYLLHSLYLLAIFVTAFSLGGRLGPAGVYAWVLPAIAIAAYGLAEWHWPFYDAHPVRYRTYERVLFDGQANHFAGFHAIATGIGLALASEKRFRALGLSLFLLSTLALATTFSRTGAAAWAAAATLWLLMRFPRLGLGVIAAGATGLLCAPASWWPRVSAPGTSMFDRLGAWKSALSTLPQHPLLGLGAGARHRSFYDSQYFMTLAESGILGLVLLLFLFWSMARLLDHARKRPGLPGALNAGALIALAALCVHALAAVSLIITVVAGPFFWWAGYALAQGRTAAPQSSPVADSAGARPASMP